VYNSFTLLNLAILFAKSETVQHLLGQMKADPTRRDEKGRNALHMAAKFNREKKIIDLLLNKIPIDQCDATGTTALHHAIMTSNTEIVEYLLDNGADPKKQDQIGRWPLYVAAFYATDTKIIDLLLDKKEIIDVNDCDKFGVTALHNAAMASNSKMARHLLANGANINCRDKNGLTPFHVAVIFAKDMEMIDLFLNNEKVNLHYCDKLGQNVIAYAQKNAYGIREKIIERVKEIDDGVIKEYYLLKLAKSEMHTPIWKILINNLHGYFSNNTFTFQTSNPSELFYVPYADLKPGKGSEISESVLICYIANKASRKHRNFAQSKMPGSIQLLSDIDHDSQITEIQIYNRSKNNSTTHLTRAFFFVFKTTSKKDGEHRWSLERNVNYVVLHSFNSNLCFPVYWEMKNKLEID
jgi:ankyrin repeat protein